LDPAFSDAVYRFTLLSQGSAPVMGAGGGGGIALYEAANATSPMRLLACATGGSDGTYGSTMGTAEATCLTPGYKIYVRVWGRTATPATANFSICVRGQRISTLTGANDRGADETPCTARTISQVSSFGTSNFLPVQVVNYVYACEESGFLTSDEDYVGGDLWAKLLVPSVGHVRLKVSYATAPGNRVGSSSTEADNVGVSAYLSPDCSDPAQFRQVASTNTLVTPASPGAIIEIKCLPAGEWLYLRIHSLSGSSFKKKRFGQLRLEWMPGGLPYPGWTPADRPAETQPCDAIPLTVGSTCASPVTGSTVGACSAPGIPEPSCGGFSGGSKQSVWYKFTAPNSGMVVIDAQAGVAPATQPAIALYTTNAMAGDPGDGCNRRFNLVDCDDRQGDGPNARIIQGALYPGQEYYIRVWAKAGAPEGNFTLCVSSPPPPAGTCWYMVDLWALNTSGSLAMEVTIPPGPMVTYTTTGGDPSQSFLISVPIGASATFHMVPAGGGVGTTGYIFYALWQVGSSDTLWYDDGGYAVAGPTAGPNDHFTLTNACSPRSHPRTDCFGMQTICMNGGATHLSGQFDNRSWPISSYSPAETDYQGYTFRPHNGGMYDLAGANMGCLDGEATGIQWMVFHPDQDGTVAFLMEGYRVYPAPTTQADLDFAIWDLGMLDFQGTVPDSINGYDVCPPQTAPVRCSSARNAATTGLAPGMFAQQEGHGGWGWLEPLPVLAGHGYLIAMVPADVTGRINYNLDWTLYQNTSGVSDPDIISCEPLLLPVELLFLHGEPRGEVVDLTWATATEKNSSHFTVERSGNARDFVPIGRVAASGNSQQTVNYGFTDTDPLMGLNYYRLRMVDLDGTTDVSNTVVVMMAGNGDRLMAYPNPVEDLLHVAMDLRVDGAAQLEVLDALGRVVQSRPVQVNAGRNLLDLDAGMLKAGTYAVRLVGNDGGELGVVRFVKQ
jgi:hypothetical protein